MDSDQLEAAINEMGFEMVDNGVMELPVSKPAAFSFEEPAELNIDAIESKMGEHGFTVFDINTEQKDTGEFYAHFHILTDHYKKCSVKMWQGDMRVYPREDGLDTYEFSRIVKGIEETSGTAMVHDPIERD